DLGFFLGMWTILDFLARNVKRCLTGGADFLSMKVVSERRGNNTNGRRKMMAKTKAQATPDMTDTLDIVEKLGDRYRAKAEEAEQMAQLLMRTRMLIASCEKAVELHTKRGDIEESAGLCAIRTNLTMLESF